MSYRLARPPHIVGAGGGPIYVPARRSSTMVELPTTNTGDRTVVTEGYFEREVRLSSAQTAALLRELADQVEAGDELTVSSEDWEIPFRFADPIEVEVEFIGDGTRELEIELEFEWGGDDDLNVE